MPKIEPQVDQPAVDRAAARILLFARTLVGVSPEHLRDAIELQMPEKVRLICKRRPELVRTALPEVNMVPVLYATKCGFPDVVRELLRLGASVNCFDSNCNTPLHMAAAGGNIEVVVALLLARADVGARNKNQETPMLLAAREGHLHIVKALKRYGSNANAREREGFTPLIFAAKRGDSRMLRELVTGAKKEVEVTGGKTTALTAAVDEGHADIVRRLTEQGFACKPVAMLRRLMRLAELKDGHFDIMRHLFFECAWQPQDDDPTLVTLMLSKAVATGRKDLAKEVLEWDRGLDHIMCEDSLRLAASIGSLRAVQEMLCRRKLKVDQEDPRGRTALSLASEAGYATIVEELILWGADVNKLCRLSFSPLYYAAKSDRPIVVKILLTYGATVDPPRNRSPGVLLAAAIDVRRGPLLQMLLDHGSDVRAVYEGHSLLSYAVERGWKDGVRILMDSGHPRPDARSMVTAMRANDLGMMKLLLSFGGDANTKDPSTGKTMLMLAAEAGYIALLGHLISAGANVDYATLQGETALILAGERGQMEAVAVLLAGGAKMDAEIRTIVRDGLVAKGCSRAEVKDVLATVPKKG